MHTSVLRTEAKDQARPSVVQIESATEDSGTPYASPGTKYRVLPTGSGGSEWWFTPGTHPTRQELPSLHAYPLPLSEALPALRRPGAVSRGDQSDLLAARSAHLPSRHRQLRDAVRQVLSTTVLS